MGMRNKEKELGRRVLLGETEDEETMMRKKMIDKANVCMYIVYRMADLPDILDALHTIPE